MKREEVVESALRIGRSGYYKMVDFLLYNKDLSTIEYHEKLNNIAEDMAISMMVENESRILAIEKRFQFIISDKNSEIASLKMELSDRNNSVLAVEKQYKSTISKGEKKVETVKKQLKSADRESLRVDKIIGKLRAMIDSL